MIFSSSASVTEPHSGMGLSPSGVMRIETNGNMLLLSGTQDPAGSAKDREIRFEMRYLCDGKPMIIIVCVIACKYTHIFIFMYICMYVYVYIFIDV